MYFYLKEPNKGKETSIIIQFSVKSEGNLFKYSTGEKIHPDNWDFTNRLPKSKKGALGAKLKNITTSIMRYDNLLERLIDSSKVNDIVITRDYLKTEFNKHFKKKVVQGKKKFTYLTDLVDDFILKTPNLINRATKRKYSAAKIRDYKKANMRLKYFEGKRKARIKIEAFNIDVYDEYLKHLLEEQNYSINYVGSLIINVKKFLKIASTEYKYEVHEDYTNGLFSTIREEVEAIALSEAEIEQLYNYDFSYDSELENCRNLAIIGFWTGLRIQDLRNLPEIDINSMFITVEPRKTKYTSGVKVVIPLHDQIKEMLTKSGMPKTISDTKFNKCIKEICKKVGLTSMCSGSIMIEDEKTGELRKKKGVYPKYKLVTSHTCRRSFATNLFKIDFSMLSIMKITGHTTQKSFLKYIKITPTEYAEKLLKHWENYYGKKKPVCNQVKVLNIFGKEINLPKLTA